MSSTEKIVRVCTVVGPLAYADKTVHTEHTFERRHFVVPKIEGNDVLSKHRRSKDMYSKSVIRETNNVVLAVVCGFFDDTIQPLGKGLMTVSPS